MPKKIVNLQALGVLVKQIESTRKEAYRLFMASTNGSPTEKALDRVCDALSLAETLTDDHVKALRSGPTPRSFAPSDELCRAIAFQRRVKLGYGNEVRLIEPSLIRQARTGMLLIAMRIDEGKAPEVRSYRIDRIQSVEVTDEPFTAPE